MPQVPFCYQGDANGRDKARRRDGPGRVPTHDRGSTSTGRREDEASCTSTACVVQCGIPATAPLKWRSARVEASARGRPPRHRRAMSRTRGVASAGKLAKRITRLPPSRRLAAGGGGTPQARGPRPAKPSRFPRDSAPWRPRSGLSPCFLLFVQAHFWIGKRCQNRTRLRWCRPREMPVVKDTAAVQSRGISTRAASGLPASRSMIRSVTVRSRMPKGRPARGIPVEKGMKRSLATS